MATIRHSTRGIPLPGQKPPYYSTTDNGNVGGPISKSASFFFNVDRRDVNELSVINATDPTGDGNLKIAENDSQSAAADQYRSQIRLGHQQEQHINGSLSVLSRHCNQDNLESVFSADSQAYSPKSTEHTFKSATHRSSARKSSTKLAFSTIATTKSRIRWIPIPL